MLTHAECTDHLHMMCRFCGELFGLGNNHTKYKSKGYQQSNNGAPQQLQYNSMVHYGTGMMHPNSNGIVANGNFTYDENGY